MDFLARPLITGASISADWTTASPGKRLAWRYGGPRSARVLARGGSRGRDVIHLVQPDHLDDRSCIIALDFLFWDSVESHEDTEASLDALKKLATLAQKKGIPLILGEIPGLLPFQFSQARLNAAMYRLSETMKNCFIIPLDQIFRDVVSAGVSYRGRRYFLPDLLPDGLHLSELASEFLADQIELTVQRRSMSCTDLGNEQNVSQ